MTQALKLSRYNWCIDEGNYLIFYNGFTGALARIDETDKIEMLRTLLTDGNIREFSRTCNTHFIETLITSGYLVPDSFDEREFLRLHTNKAKYNGNLAITAVLTTGCNFACSYCYENLDPVHSENMTEKTADSIYDLCNQLSPKKLFVTLYGGEPLLNIDVALYLLNKLQELEDCSLYANIVTNGYLFDGATAKILEQNGVKSAQITLDGLPETHNTQRSLKTGGNTYEKVVSNIIAASEYIKIQVRVNIDIDAQINFKHVVTLFSEYPNIFVYPAAIRDYSSEAACTIPDYDILTDQIGINSMPNLRISAKQPGCIATNMTGIVIQPDGSLAKCWREVSSQDSSTYGEMPYGMDVRSIAMVHSKWSDFNPYNADNYCYDCKMLPSCGGGCPYDHVFDEQIKCKYSISTFEQYIKKMYNHQLKEHKEHKEHKDIISVQS